MKVIYVPMLFFKNSGLILYCDLYNYIAIFDKLRLKLNHFEVHLFKNMYLIQMYLKL